MTLKFRANFPNLVAMLRECFSRTKKFLTKCLMLYRCLSNSALFLRILKRQGIIGFMHFFLVHSRFFSKSHPLSAIKQSAPSILSINSGATGLSWASPAVILKSIEFPSVAAHKWGLIVRPPQ